MVEAVLWANLILLLKTTKPLGIALYTRVYLEAMLRKSIHAF
jgi:hypothetical protein